MQTINKITPENTLPAYMLWWEGLDFLELESLTTKYWLTPIEDVYKAEHPLLNKETKGSEVGYTGEWKYEPSSNDVDFLIYSPNNLMPVFMTCEDGLALHYQNKELAEQNAQLIVKAVNNHDALVSALKEAIKEMELINNIYPDRVALRIAQAKAAIQ